MSGDAQREDYNEVDPMKKRAIELGVPEECIITDTMGLSTFESMKRLKMSLVLTSDNLHPGVPHVQSNIQCKENGY